MAAIHSTNSGTGSAVAPARPEPTEVSPWRDLGAAARCQVDPRTCLRSCLPRRRAALTRRHSRPNPPPLHTQTASASACRCCPCALAVKCCGRGNSACAVAEQIFGSSPLGPATNAAAHPEASASRGTCMGSAEHLPTHTCDFGPVLPAPAALAGFQR